VALVIGVLAGTALDRASTPQGTPARADERARPAFGEARLLMDVDLERFARRVGAQSSGESAKASATAQARTAAPAAGDKR
jgi:hypothetical protein